jgi:hypothetical protein
MNTEYGIYGADRTEDADAKCKPLTRKNDKSKVRG